jgi:hypothetical protein
MKDDVMWLMVNQDIAKGKTMWSVRPYYSDLPLPDGVYENVRDAAPGTRAESVFIHLQIVNGLAHSVDRPLEMLFDGGTIYMWFYEGIDRGFDTWCELMNLTAQDKMIYKLKYFVK